MIFMLILLHAWVEKGACVDTYLLVLSFLKNMFLYLWKNIYKQKSIKWKGIYNGPHNLFRNMT